MIQKFSTFKRAGIGIFIAFLLTVPVFGLAYAAPVPATTGDTVLAADGVTECIGGFSINIRAGTGTGQSIGGVLKLRANNTTGELRESELTLDNNAGSMTVSGQVTGQAIAMVFEQGNTVMFGVGVMQKKLSDCSGLAAGPVVGGGGRDSRGDWDFFEGIRDARGN